MSAELSERVAELQWYHTLELAPGVVTPGWFDLRGVPTRLPMPASLADRRCLDIGTFDGFWAFEMERRGADEVVAIDVLDPRNWDWPAGHDAAVEEQIGRRKARGSGFEIAREALGSKVERHELSVYDLTAEILGQFDFVYLGSLLLHLRDPVLALERVREVCRGQALVVDAIEPELSRIHRHTPMAKLDGLGRPWWWQPTIAGFAGMVRSAGLEIVEGPVRLSMPCGAGQPVRAPRNPLRLLTSSGRHQARLARRGDPHAGLLAVPA